MGIVSDPSSRGKGFVTARLGGGSGEREWRGEAGVWEADHQGRLVVPEEAGLDPQPGYLQAPERPHPPLGPIAFFWLRGGCVP